jgi:cellulose synthase/poly-beta-1,6-N-acetylglucosamine synthase-like glycosyltransferase
VTAEVVAASLLVIAAPFALYPLALFLRATFAPRAVASAEHTPQVDLIVCAHNEAASIGAKIENALALDYPREHLTICIASDGSTDATVALARGFEGRGVRVLDLPRRGKAHALEAAVRATHGEVIAFSDANSEWARGALRALVRPFADPQVGGVAGDQRYRTDDAAVDGTTGERSYWSFDRQLKRWQSRAGSAISATGAIYAVRRSLFEAPPPDATDDFMISTAVIAQGRRLVFAEDAIALEPPSETHGGEFRRKVRITTRGLRGVFYRRGLLNPFAHGAYAIELAIHKLWRRLTWIPLVVLVGVAPMCWASGGVLSVVGGAVAGSVGIGGLGLAVPRLRRWRPVAIAAYVVMVNAACAVATLNAVRGHRVARWEPAREAGEWSGGAS